MINLSGSIIGDFKKEEPHEQEAQQTPEPEEGGDCPECRFAGSLIYAREPCTCGIHPAPCSACENAYLYCPVCDANFD